MALLALGSSLLVATGGPSSAQVSEVSGGAFGYHLEVSLFGAPQPVVGPTPTVTLPGTGSATPITGSAPTGSAGAGPAQFYSSGLINLSTEGTPADATVISSTEITSLNTSGNEAMTADAVTSNCEAAETGVTGATTFTNGVLAIDSGDDVPNDAIPDHPPVFVDIPDNPPANDTYEGHIHVNGTTDTFRYVFNEQVETADSITVNAGHQYILGPTAVGDLIFGQSVCSLAAAPVTTTTAPPAVTTTVAGGGTTTGGTGQQPLARTGGGNSKLVIPAASALLLGAMLLFGFGDRPGWAGATAARRIHRRRAPWDRRRR